MRVGLSHPCTRYTIRFEARRSCMHDTAALQSIVEYCPLSSLSALVTPIPESMRVVCDMWLYLDVRASGAGAPYWTLHLASCALRQTEMHTRHVPALTLWPNNE